MKLDINEQHTMFELPADLALFIEQREDAHFVLDQIDAWLIVVELDKCPSYALAHIFFLFKLKHVHVELLLELFVCVVDAKLLKAAEDETGKGTKWKGKSNALTITEVYTVLLTC
jgi:hypothetical protein